MSEILQLLGLVAIVAAVAMVWGLPAAMVATGGALLLIGEALG